MIPFCTGGAAFMPIDWPFSAAIKAGELARGSATDGKPMVCPKCQTLAPVRVERLLGTKTFLRPHLPDRYEVIIGEFQSLGDGEQAKPARAARLGDLQPAELLEVVDASYHSGNLDHPDYVAWREAFVAEHRLG